MKRAFVVAAALSMFLGTSLFAQSLVNGGTSRAFGLGGAMTAVNDDINALFYNPAGLGGIKKPFFAVSANASAYLRNDEVDQPNIDQNGDDHWSDQEIAAYDAYRSVAHFVRFSARPSLMVGGPNYAAAVMGEFGMTKKAGSAYGSPDYYDKSYSMSRTLSAVAGLSYSFGPLSIGENVRYSRRDSSSIDFAYISAPTYSSMLSDIMAAQGDFTGVQSLLEFGTAVSATFGSLTASALSVIPIMDSAAVGGNSDSLSKILDGTNLGLCWKPLDNATLAYMSFSFLVAADVQNLGDMYSRQLSVGAEAEVSMRGGSFGYGGRVGYSQPLGYGKSLSAIDSIIDTDLGKVSAGFSVTFLFVRVDLAASLNASEISNPSPTNNGAIAPMTMNGTATITL
jgi:hypothetical protein